MKLVQHMACHMCFGKAVQAAKVMLTLAMPHTACVHLGPAIRLTGLSNSTSNRVLLAVSADAHRSLMQEKIRKSLASYRAVERQIVQELVDKELDCSQPEGPLTAAVSLLDAPEAAGPPAMNPLIAEGIAKLAPEAFEKSKLLETASAKQLADHFSLERIRRIVDTAQRVLTQASDTDSSGDEEELPVAADVRHTDLAAAARIKDPDYATVPAAAGVSPTPRTTTPCHHSAFKVIADDPIRWARQELGTSEL